MLLIIHIRHCYFNVTEASVCPGVSEVILKDIGTHNKTQKRAYRVHILWGVLYINNAVRRYGS